MTVIGKSLTSAGTLLAGVLAPFVASGLVTTSGRDSSPDCSDTLQDNPVTGRVEPNGGRWTPQCQRRLIAYLDRHPDLLTP
jgi:hypothetical protein